MCVEEVPLLQSLHKKYGDQAAFVGISLDEDMRALDRMVRQKKIVWPQLCDGQGTKGGIARRYAIEGTPTLYLIDAQGKIAARLGSAKLLDDKLAALVAGQPVEDFSGPRDRWQRPADVMNGLRIEAGSVVADIGAGDGYFSFHLARRAGLRGKVYAVDLDEKALAQLKERAGSLGLTNIEIVRSKPDDPSLPEGALDAALIVNAYHEFTAYDAMLQGIYRALRPGGLLGVLEWHAEAGQPRKEYEERHELPGEILIADAVRNGFRIHTFYSDFAKPPHQGNGPQDRRPYYFVIFRKPAK
ncbi:MAG: methyltransferase domain-containing protein [Candidatus Acidiferrales bacterium]